MSEDPLVVRIAITERDSKSCREDIARIEDRLDRGNQHFQKVDLQMQEHDSRTEALSVNTGRAQATAERAEAKADQALSISKDVVGLMTALQALQIQVQDLKDITKTWSIYGKVLFGFAGLLSTVLTAILIKVLLQLLFP